MGNKSDNLIIGFANSFYTLWSFRNESLYFTDSYGNHHLKSTITYYDFIKNISIDLDKVKTSYPNITIDENIRGKSSWSVKKDVDQVPANILTFGKYCGKSIEEISDSDFNYLLWLKSNCYKKTTIDAINNLPSIIKYFEKIEADKKAFVDSMIIAQDGDVEIEFLSNPNYYGCDFVYDESIDLSKKYSAEAILIHNGVRLEDNKISIYFDDIKPVLSKYPYNMAIINGKAMKIKGKTMILPLQILDTIKNSNGSRQVAKVR